MRPRELPPLPQRGQRTLPTMPSEDSPGEAPKRRKKKIKKQVTEVDGDDLEMDGMSSRRASESGGRLSTDLEGRLSTDPGGRVSTDPGGRISTDPGRRLSTDPLPDTIPQQKKRRRKKKAATIDLDDDQTDLVTAETVEQNTDGEEVVKKPKKKRKSRPPEVPLSDEFTVEEDDITTDGPPAPPHTLFAPPQAQSQPVPKVFVERNKRFQATERAGGSRCSVQLDHMDLQPMTEWSTRDVSVHLHQGFRMLGLFAQGFLAGFAVWHIVVVYVLAGPHLMSLSNLLQQYNGLAYPCQSLLYLLLALSTVSAFDRVNLAKGSVALRQLMTLEPVALASFLYFCALILCLSQQMTSDRINLYPSLNNSLWPMGSEQQTLHPWVTVNLVVALLVGLSWVFISTRPDTDHTEVSLMSMRIEPPKEEKSEMTA